MPRSPQDILPWVLHEISFPTDPKEDKDPHKVQLSIDVRPNGIILEFVQRLFEDPRLVKPTSVSAVPQEDENTTAHDSGIGTGSGLPSMLDIQEEQARPTVSNFRHYKENQDPNNVESSKPVRSKKTKRESAQPSAKEEQKLSSQF
ncbi:uncharacterized protein LOC116415915 [Nasonia vitripennis]|uniref:Uncharacterized protein n=1 Tax=Nasonia vitripennis TaxID=7425 RepID=A0A7M7PVT2_NASVI|nr:uncharacterized protein LOC116415914 [Nasonia vitripennis]XP_031777416.1 uncharacterized protein LOC116415915 [Nasonia vitripennis]